MYAVDKCRQQMELNIKLKRVYESADDSDGLRILVDRMWPRGIKKRDLKYDIWAKDVTPSLGLRRFFHDNPYGNWNEFADRYRIELIENPTIGDLIEQIRESGFYTVTLLYGFRNPVKNHAVVLREVLMSRLGGE